MKSITTLLLVFLLIAAVSVQAQTPRLISYQGVLTDATGKLVNNGNHVLKLTLYTDATSSASVFTETQTVPVVNGLFNVILGSVTAIPSSVAFDRAYFLGVSVDGGAELTPRTALVSSPYAFHAIYADSAGKTGGSGGGSGSGVTSLNGMSGDITLVSGGTTTINKDAANKKITISSSGGGSGSSGVQGIQNTDGTLSIGNGSGPVATINIVNSAIDSNRLATNSVTLSKIAAGVIPSQLPPSGPAGGDLNGYYPNPNVVKIQNYSVSNNPPQAGQVFAWDANNQIWKPTSFSITLPMNASDNSSTVSMAITNTGGGTAIKGSGTIGVAGTSSDNSGKGVMGSSPNFGVYGISGNAGPQPSPNTGIGVFGTTDVATGVAGTSSGGDGVQGISSLSGGAGVHGVSSNGSGSAGVVGESVVGYGVKASYTGGNNSGNALDVDNGYIKVTGNTKTAYIHTVAQANINANAAWSTFLNYPGMTSTDIVLVTHQFTNVALKKNIGNNNFDGISYGVTWNAANNRWEIYLEDQQTNMPVGERFNILVIKQ